MKKLTHKLNKREKCKQVQERAREKQIYTIMESNNLKFSDDPSVTLTIRLIMQGKVSCRFHVYLGNFHQTLQFTIHIASMHLLFMITQREVLPFRVRVMVNCKSNLY